MESIKKRGLRVITGAGIVGGLVSGCNLNVPSKNELEATITSQANIIQGGSIQEDNKAIALAQGVEVKDIPQKWNRINVIDAVLENGVQIYTTEFFEPDELARVICVYDGTCNLDDSGGLNQSELDALAVAKDLADKNFGKTSPTVPGKSQMIDDGLYYQTDVNGVLYTSTTKKHGLSPLQNGNFLRTIKAVPANGSYKAYAQVAYARNSSPNRPYPYIGSRKLNQVGRNFDPNAGEAMFIAIEVDQYGNEVGQKELIAGACANPARESLFVPKQYIAPTAVNTPPIPVINPTEIPGQPTQVPPDRTRIPPTQFVPTVTQAATQPPQPTRTPGGTGENPVVPTPFPTEAPVATAVSAPPRPTDAPVKPTSVTGD